MNDMIPPDKRTIRHIPVERAKRTKEEVTPSAESFIENSALKLEEEPVLPPPPPRFQKEGSVRRFWLWGLGIVFLLLVLVILVSSAFAGATLAVTPQEERVTVSGQFVAHTTPPPGELGFVLMTLTETGRETVAATGEREVDAKASGTIVIFNDFSDETERLIKNTRFETPEGLVYRLDQSVDVPGRSENPNGETVPGSVEAVVFADTSGVRYNTGLTDFTIPGLEEANDPRFFKIYARSKTPMTGGFSGVQKTVSEADEETARAAIRRNLRESLLMRATAELPEGSVLYDDAVFVEFTAEPNQNTDDAGNVDVVERGTLYGLVFNQAALASHIAKNTIARYANEPVRFRESEDLRFALVDKEMVAPAAVDMITFTLDGSGHVIWTFDETRLKEDLAGKRKQDIDTVLSGYPSIERAEITLRPFWKQAFPENTNRIKIEETLTTPQEAF
jgi:hypothetical protein